MSPDFRKVKEVFLNALDRAEVASREDFLNAACGSDEAMRAQVEALLQRHMQAGSFLEHPAVSPPVPDLEAPTVPPGELPPTAAFEPPPVSAGAFIAGRYKLLEEIGEGGMGSVWMAEQTEPIQRRVAVKLIKPGMDSRQVVARFEAERQALALMDHPNIAKVLDGGATPDGRPYFVMELVKGTPITKFCDEKKLNVRERLELFGDVCRAVQHAHQKGIIHRDLKPSNVLVAPYDGRPVVKVIDFGVAKATGQKLTEATLFTGFGAVVGTPEYMSPEQAEVNNQDIDTRSDIYSLGVLLYELLTGSTPLTRKRAKDAAFLEVLRLIREEEPPKPSTRLSSTEELPSISAQRQSEPAKLTKLVRGELDWIVMKALEKDRNRRYETANGFAMDVQRYLADEAVQACPPSVGYRFRKFTRRNMGKLVAVSLVLLALLIGIFGTTWGLLKAQAERDQKEFARQEAESNFQRTLNVVDEFYTQVSQNTIFEVPGLQPVRSDLLEKARDYYEETARKRPDDPQIRASLAATYFRLSIAYFDVDRMDDHVLTMKRGVEIAEQLQEQFPETTEAHSKLAGVWSGSRRMQVSSPTPKDHEQARNNLQRFIAVWQKFHAAQPNQSLFERDIAAAQMLLGSLHNSLAWRNNQNQHANQAKQMLGSCIPILEKLIAADPAERVNREFLAIALSEYAHALTHLGDKQGANQYRERRDRTSEALAQDFPERYREYALGAKTKLMNEFIQSGNDGAAEKACLEAMRLLDVLLREQPGLTQYGHKKLNLVKSLVQIRQRLRKPSSIDESLEELLATCRERSRTWPNQPTMQAEFINALKYAAERARIARDYATAETYLKECLEAYEKKHAFDSPDFETEKIRFYLWEMREHYQQTGKLQERDQVCRKALELSKQLTERYAHQPSYYHWEVLGLARYHGRKYAEAVAALTRALELRSDLYAGWHLRGDAYSQLMQHHQAIRDYTKAIELDPQHVWSWRARGWSYTMLGEWAKAADDYQQAIHRDASHPSWHFDYGIALDKIGRSNDAIAAYRKAIELEPTNALFLEKLAWLLCTTSDVKLRDSKEAVLLGRRAVQLDPKAWAHWNTLSIACFRAGDWKGALEARQNAIQRKDDGSARCWNGLGLAMIRWQLGEQAEARKAYDQVIEEAKKLVNNADLKSFLQEAEELLKGKPKRK